MAALAAEKEKLRAEKKAQLREERLKVQKGQALAEKAPDKPIWGEKKPQAIAENVPLENDLVALKKLTETAPLDSKKSLVQKVHLANQKTLVKDNTKKAVGLVEKTAPQMTQVVMEKTSMQKLEKSSMQKGHIQKTQVAEKPSKQKVQPLSEISVKAKKTLGQAFVVPKPVREVESKSVTKDVVKPVDYLI